MRIRSRLGLGSGLAVSAAVATLVIAFAANCGGRATSTSVNPNVPSTSSPSAVPPATITAISPSEFVAGLTPQTITVSGTNFQTGLTLSITTSDGTAVTSPSLEITKLTPTSFEANPVLPFVDTPSFRVTNPGAAASNPFTVQVKPAPIAPTITTVSLNTSIAAPTTETVTVHGIAFQSGLKLIVTKEGGDTTVFSDAQIVLDLEKSGFTVSMSVSAGTYAFQVANPDATVSNVVSKTVEIVAPPSASAPTISSLLPALIVARPAEQTVEVIGAHFVAGLTLSVTDSAGGRILVSGAQIRLLASNIFDATLTIPRADKYSFQVTTPDGQSSNVRTVAIPGVGSDACATAKAPPRLGDVKIYPGSDPYVTMFGTLYEDDGTRVMCATNCPWIEKAIVTGACQPTLSTLECPCAGFQAVFRRTASSGTCGLALSLHNTCGVQTTQTVTFDLPPVLIEPVITAIVPASFTASSTPQTITVQGHDFPQGLWMVTSCSVRCGGALIDGAKITDVTPTSFRAVVTFGSPGAWSLQVRAPLLQSNFFAVTVPGLPATPLDALLRLFNMPPTTATTGKTLDQFLRR